jgi:hypothetical protein
MVHSVSPSSPATQWQVQQSQQNVTHKQAKPAEQQDSVVLSKQAQGAVDADHDGDSH